MMLSYKCEPCKHIVVLAFIFLSVFCSSGFFESIVGHLQPFGSHRPPDITTKELHTVPHPREFWENFVKPRKPVVFRGAAAESR